MGRLGKSGLDIFAATVAAPEAPRSAGRPPIHDEEWTKVTVVLFNRQIVYLDRLANDIRARTGAAIKRAELIRSLVDALETSGVDLTGATSEREIAGLLAEHLQAAR